MQVKSDDAEAMGRIFSAVGLTFMLRLLATPGSPGTSGDRDAGTMRRRGSNT